MDRSRATPRVTSEEDELYNPKSKPGIHKKQVQSDLVRAWECIVDAKAILSRGLSHDDLRQLGAHPSQAPNQAKSEEEAGEGAALGKAGESKEDEAKREKREAKHRKNKGSGEDKVTVVHVPLTGLKAALEANK